MIGTTARLSVEEAQGVVGDKALLRRIWCPIDVLDETLWAEANNAWILLLASRSVNYIRPRAPYLKANETNMVIDKTRWDFPFGMGLDYPSVRCVFHAGQP